MDYVKSKYWILYKIMDLRKFKFISKIQNTKYNWIELKLGTVFQSFGHLCVINLRWAAFYAAIGDLGFFAWDGFSTSLSHGAQGSWTTLELLVPTEMYLVDFFGHSNFQSCVQRTESGSRLFSQGCKGLFGRNWVF